MIDDKEYSENELDLRLREGEQRLEKMQFQEAETAFRAAREAAFALTLSARLAPIDHLIQHTRDQQQWYEQIRIVASQLSQLTDMTARLKALQRLGDIIGQTTAMEYHLLTRQARAVRHEAVVSLDHAAAIELAQRAMDQQDYELVIELLGGLHDASQTDTLQRAEHLHETDIDPKLQQALQLRTQGRPLDGLGPLRDLRRDFPLCPAWRMPWFAAARAQGEYQLERGRRKLSDAEYDEARSIFREAQLVFEQGAEAYPDECSTQLLLTEARDLRELAVDLGKAYAAQQAQSTSEALRQFEAIAAKLRTWAEAGRDYSLLQFEVALYLKRLRASTASSDSVRIQLTAITQALTEGRFDQAALFLAEIEPGQLENSPNLAAEVRQLRSTLEGQRQQRQQLVQEVEQLAERAPLIAAERWLEVAREQAVGPAPISLIDQVTLVVITARQQRDWDLADKGLAMAKRLGVANSQLSELQKQLAAARQTEPELARAAYPAKVVETNAQLASAAVESSIDKSAGDTRRLLRQIKSLIEAGKYEAARETLREAENSGLPDQQIEIFDQIIQAGQRLAGGREFLEQGEFELAVARLKSAVVLAKDRPEADLIYADAQLWLRRALEKSGHASEPLSLADSMVITPPTNGQTIVAQRLIDWAVTVEPCLAQVRTAYLTGDQAKTLALLRGLIRLLSNDQAPT